MGIVLGHVIAALYFLTLIAFGTALATSPVYSTIKGWHGRSDLQNTLRILGAAVAVLVGLGIVFGALRTGIVFPPRS